jgi:hypothetical protein
VNASLWVTAIERNSKPDLAVAAFARMQSFGARPLCHGKFEAGEIPFWACHYLQLAGVTRNWQLISFELVQALGQTNSLGRASLRHAEMEDGGSKGMQTDSAR